MSFAADTKAGLCSLFVKKSCCRRALLLGILRAAYIFCDREIRFTTRNRSTAALTTELLSEQFGLHPASETAEDAAQKEPDGEGSYPIVLLGDDAQKIADCFPPAEDGFRAALPDLDPACRTCAACYLRGVFLSCGNVASPDACYHLDMVLSEDGMAESFGYFLEEHGLPPKHTARKGMPVLYYKESESIEDFLTFIGAQKSAFALMETKIMKDVRNNANRMINCELANLEKTVGAATVQYEAICDLIAAGRFSLLPVELQQTAKLRYEHPDLPLKDLAALHEPELTKSGLNHRLKKIVDFAAEEKEAPGGSDSRSAAVRARAEEKTSAAAGEKAGHPGETDG